MSAVVARTGWRAAVDVVVLVSAMAVALIPLIPVYGAAAAVPAIAGGLVLGAGVAVLGALRRWSAMTVVAGLVLAYLLCGGAFAAPSTTIAGVLPTADTLLSLAAGAATTWKQVLTLQPPLGAAANFLVVPFTSALVGSAVATATTLRARRPARAALAAVAPMAVLVLAVLLGTRQTFAPVAAGVALGVVLLGWASWRGGLLRARRVVAVVSLVGLTVAGGMAGAPLVVGDTPRFVLRDEIVPPFDPSAYPSPLSGFRKLVKEKDVELFTASGLPAGARVRLATMDRFDGVVWNVAGDGSAAASGEFRRVGETIDTSASGEQARVRIEVRELAGVWLPTVGQARAVEVEGASDADLRYNDATGSAVLTSGLRPGLSYTLDVVVPDEPSDEVVGDASAASVVVPGVASVPDAVAVAAASVARDAGTPVQIARSLEKALTEDGYFSHGLSGDYPSLSGHGADRLTSLLGGDLMVGDGEQYASAMALMARQMGLPSRVVIGFVAPQDRVEDAAASRDAEPDADAITFTGDDVEAWVEIAFAGHGWVAFDPTPPRAQTPQEDATTKPSDPEPQVVQPPPAPPEPDSPPEDDTEQPQAQDPDPEPDNRPLWWRVLLVAGVATAPLLLLASPFLLVVALKLRRRRRRRRHPDAVGRVAGGWDEVLDAVHDLGRPTSPLATRRETAQALAGSFADRAPEAGAQVAAIVRVLAEEADAVVFGPDTPGDHVATAYWSRVDAALARLRASVSRRRWWRSRVSLASGRERRRRARRDRARGRPKAGAHGAAPHEARRSAQVDQEARIP
ncbi:transglutaminaseTgpA domain-containing protein [Cellulomonas cellasea]|uniref:transglutaminase family protein n=1 Tax=Cellulomonas cellasea TaxID=43670 RepID=UPI0025A388AC|nr:transglutaminase domain-containing protein [Cellulomonas cellasea]MDM8084135.1 transglutaminaseTgpA domain-containing protein [Cellulomonas cellasea]